MKHVLTKATLLFCSVLSLGVQAAPPSKELQQFYTESQRYNTSQKDAPQILTDYLSAYSPSDLKNFLDSNPQLKRSRLYNALES